MSVDAADLEALRRRLTGFCYQLLGSPFDAEDAVQDTLEKAWRARASFDPRAGALSTWVFRIARNVCFDRLRETPRKQLPRDLRDPGIEVGAPLVPASDVPWLMPAPTHWVEDSEPERAVVSAERTRLAVTALLQTLPPRQRGVFVLRDLLGCSAAETASILEMSVPAVTSSVQRARAALRDGGLRRGVALRSDVVERYARAIERGDVGALAALVADDVLFEMPPVLQWSFGRDTYTTFMSTLFDQRGTTWATRPISANGQRGILLFLATGGHLVPHTVQLFDADPTGAAIGHVLVYRDDRLFDLFASNRPPTDEFGRAHP